jgi:[ribosomal protein S5]-alanine N-acetyltransferase
MTILETPRLYLRQFTPGDAPLLLQLNSDPEVLKYLHEPLLQTAAEAEKVLTDIILPQYALNLGRWAVHLKADDQFIGWCGLKSRPELNEIDLGYRFKKDSWGKGYASEAALHALQYGLETLHIETITGRAHIDNIASLKILEKIGMSYLKDEMIENCPVKTFVAIRKNS